MILGGACVCVGAVVVSWGTSGGGVVGWVGSPLPHHPYMAPTPPNRSAPTPTPRPSLPPTNPRLDRDAGFRGLAVPHFAMGGCC